MYVCVLCACCVQGNQKRKSDPLRGELQMVVSQHTSTGNQTQVFWLCFLIAESSLQSPGYKDCKTVWRPSQLLFLSEFGCYGKIPKAGWAIKGRSLFHSVLESESLILCDQLRQWWGLLAASQDGGWYLREDTWESQRGRKQEFRWGTLSLLPFCPWGGLPEEPHQFFPVALCRDLISVCWEPPLRGSITGHGGRMRLRADLSEDWFDSQHPHGC